MSATSDCVQLGQVVCQALRGVWRANPPAPGLSAESWQTVASGLAAAGTGALCWHALRRSPLATTPAGRSLGRDYRHALVRGATREQQIPWIVARLRRLGVEPILVKGWSSARHYALPYLRPHGDVDVCLRPNQVANVVPVLAEDPVLAQHIDLHGGIPDLRGRTWDEAFARSRLVTLNGESVRVLGAEDHLRLLNLHLVRHTLQRPLWLCDVAAAVENLPDQFDWDACLHGEPWLADWILCMVGLARELLGAQVGDSHIRERSSRFASWVVPYVLWSWGRTFLTAQPGNADGRHEPLRYLWFHKSNPLRWAWRLRLGPNHSMLRIQAQAVLSRPWQLLVRIGRRWNKHCAASLPFEIHSERTF